MEGETRNDRNGKTNMKEHTRNDTRGREKTHIEDTQSYTNGGTSMEGYTQNDTQRGRRDIYRKDTHRRTHTRVQNGRNKHRETHTE